MSEPQLQDSISVIVPVRNGARTLHAAIDSVLQDLEDHDEILVVDDGSTDSSREVVDAFQDERVKQLTNTGRGIVDALNLGIRRSMGRYVARCDADDQWLPGHRNVLVKTLISEPGAVAAFGAARLVGPGGDHAGFAYPPRAEKVHRALLKSNPLVHGTLMAHRTALIQCNGYREIAGVEDYDLWLRLLRFGKIATTPTVVYEYQLSDPDSHARKRRVQARNSLLILIHHAGRSRKLSITGILRNAAAAAWHGPRFWYQP